MSRISSIRKGTVSLLPGSRLLASANSRFLLYFKEHRLRFFADDFYHNEVRAVASAIGVDPQLIQFECASDGGVGGKDEIDVFQWASFPNATVAKIITERCSLVRALLDVWAVSFFPVEPLASADDATSCADERWQILADGVQSPCAEDAAERMVAPLGDGTWRCEIISAGRKKPRSGTQKVALLEKFASLLDRLPGKVDLKDAQHEIHLIEDCRDSYLLVEAAKPQLLHPVPSRLFLGALLARGDSAHISKLAITSRPHLSRTTLDSQTTLLMANQAHVSEGSLVLDPFCGSASTLLSCADRGAKTIGIDINLDVLTGVNENFRKFGLPLPKLIHGDFMDVDVLLDSDYARFDAVLTDPPFGLMQKTKWSKDEILHGLLHLAAKRLHLGGRLVFLWMVLVESDADDVLLKPELKQILRCLEVETISRQNIGKKVRLMVTMVKRSELPS